MRVLVSIFLILSWVTNAFAASDDLLVSLMKAKSIEGVDRLVSESRLAQEAQSECGEQLRSRKLPTSCFTKLESQMKKGELSREEGVRQKSWLSEFCLRRAEDSTDRADLKEIQSALSVPEACRKKASEREADLLYALRNSHPESVF